MWAYCLFVSDCYAHRSYFIPAFLHSSLKTYFSQIFPAVDC